MANKAGKFFLIIVLVLCLPTCAMKPTPIAYQTPHIMLPPDPIPATANLNPKSSPDQVVKAWVATATAYKKWCSIVREQISSSY